MIISIIVMITLMIRINYGDMKCLILPIHTPSKEVNVLAVEGSILTTQW